MPKTTTTQLGRLLQAMALVVLCVAVLLVAVASGRSSLFYFALGAIIVLLALGFFWWVFRKANEWTGRRDFFAPAAAFVIAYLAWFSLGFANVFDLPDYLAFGTFSPIPASQWGFYLLGLAGYVLGLWLGNANTRVAQPQVQVRNEWNPKRFWRIVVLLGCSLIGSGAVQVAQFGIPGLSPLAGEERLAIRGIPHFLFVSCAFTLVVVIPSYLWTHPTTRRTKYLATLFVVFIMVGLPLLQGGRSDLVVSLLTLFLIFHYLKRRVTLFSLVSAAVIGLIALSLTGYLRDYSLDGGQNMDWLDVLGLPPWMVPTLYVLLYIRYTVATFRDVTIMIPSQVHYQYGALSFAALKTPLPGHHDMSDMFFKNMLGNEFTGGGQPATLLGPLYGDLGALGILAGMFCFGLIACRAYHRMNRKRTLLTVMLYAWILQTGLMGLFGSLFTYIVTLSTPLLWVGFDWLVREQPAPHKSKAPARQMEYS
jgi:oligosaccharide repeat unit polymerase